MASVTSTRAVREANDVITVTNTGQGIWALTHGDSFLDRLSHARDQTFNNETNIIL